MTPAHARRMARLTLVLLAFSACTDQPQSGPVPRRTEAVTRDVRWRTLPSAPTSRTEVAASASESHLYVTGGFDENGETVHTLEVYDVDRRTWRSGPPLPIAVNHAMSAFLDRLYVIGGYLGPGLGNPTDRAFVLEGNRWSELPRMPEPRAAAGAAAVDGKLYVAGGVGPEGLAEDMLVFDPSNAKWSRMEGPPTRREHLGVAGYDGRLFVVGGRTGGIGSNLAAVEAYDPRTETWDALPDMPTARGGIAAAATTNGFVVAPGGEADATFEEAEAFDVRVGRWLSLPPMPTPRHGLGVAAIGTTVYVVAGGPTPGLSVSNANEAINLARLRPPS